MTDFVGLDVSGIKEIDAKLKKLVPAVQDAVVDDISKYYINVFQTEQPPPNHIPRAAAYGVTFFTEKQRRWFWATFGEMIRNGIDITYRRTQALRNGWRQVGTGVRSFIVNDREGAQYVVDDDKQSRHEKMVGWFRAGELANKRVDRALKVADGAVRRAIRKLGLD